MSLMLEFRPPKNRDARLAAIGTNWSFPTITPPTDAAECKLERLRRPLGKCQLPRAIVARSVSRSPHRECNSLELPVNDLLTNSGNSD
jgi:hypothetical protein